MVENEYNFPNPAIATSVAMVAVCVLALLGLALPLALSHVLSFNELAMRSTHSRRVVISTTRGTLGLGNRMLAHASAFAFALLHNRSLLVHAPDHDPGDIFCSERLRTISHGEYKSIAFRTGSHLAIDTSHDGSLRDWQRLACTDSFDDFDVVVISGGQYFIPLLLSRHHDWFEKVFGGKPSSIYSQIARYLFRPAPPVAKLYLSHLQHAQQSAGVQLRSFKLRYDRSQGTSAEKCLQLHRKAATPSLFVSSLYAEHFQWFRDRGYKAATLSHFGRQDNTLRQFQFAFAEMLLLAETPLLISSPYSTFGYAAVALRHGVGDDAYMLDSRLSCRRIRDAEPCFHKAPKRTAQCPDGSALWMDVRRVTACPDFHKRGIKIF